MKKKSLETNAVPESFTNGFGTIVYKRNITLSGLLVCRLIKFLSEVLSSKLSHSPSKLRFSVKFFIFRTLFQPRTLSVHIPAAWWDLFTKYVNIHMFVSDSFSSIKEGVVQVTDLVGYLALYPPSTYCDILNFEGTLETRAESEFETRNSMAPWPGCTQDLPFLYGWLS